jgi:hypothetical protein
LASEELRRRIHRCESSKNPRFDPVLVLNQHIS